MNNYQRNLIITASSIAGLVLLTVFCVWNAVDQPALSGSCLEGPTWETYVRIALVIVGLQMIFMPVWLLYSKEKHQTE